MNRYLVWILLVLLTASIGLQLYEMFNEYDLYCNWQSDRQLAYHQ